MRNPIVKSWSPEVEHLKFFLIGFFLWRIREPNWGWVFLDRPLGLDIGGSWKSARWKKWRSSPGVSEMDIGGVAKESPQAFISLDVSTYFDCGHCAPLWIGPKKSCACAWRPVPKHIIGQLFKRIQTPRDIEMFVSWPGGRGGHWGNLTLHCPGFLHNGSTSKKSSRCEARWLRSSRPWKQRELGHRQGDWNLLLVVWERKTRITTL